MSSQNSIQFRFGGKLNQNTVAVQFDGESQNLQASFPKFCAIFQCKLLFVQGTSHFWRTTGIAQNSLRENERLLMGAHVLGTIPFISLSIVEDGELRITDKNGGSHVGSKVFDVSDLDPRLFRLGKDIILWCLPHCLWLTILWPVGGSLLTAHVHKLDHVVLSNILLGVGKLFEFGTQLGVLDNLSPLIVVGFYKVIHAPVKFVADTKRVLDNDLFEVLNRTSPVLAGR
mmetsp:Transcript_4453/g.9342  ORF Transcript_4453/g.9342 Transcript_4453/m.9342 type:complete len:229 (+) Transcript_4453:330-1016(+)